MKEQRELRIADLGRVVALTTGMLLFKLTFFPHRLHSNSNSNSSTVFCFTEQIRIQFLFYSHSVVDYLNHC